VKAARLYGAGDMRVEEVPDPVPGRDEVVIEIAACGVCPSDVRRYADASSKAGGPWTPGHEVAGTIASAGDEVGRQWAEGTEVVLDWRGVCGVCRECRRGAANFCESLVKYAIAGFAQYTVMPAAQLRVVPGGVSAAAACFCEPLACIVNAHRALPVALASDLLVVGAGPIGLLHAQVALHRGARVVVADNHPERLDVAAKLGVHDTVQVGAAGSRQALLNLTDGRGADAVIVTVGSPAVISSSFDLVAKNGTVNLFAGTHPKATVELNPDLPHYNQVSINGSHDYIPDDFTTALRLLQFGMIDVEALVSHRFGIDEIRTAFETTRAQTGLKSLIVPT
jgi:L-iditol 2-dehydrogenase